MVSLAELIEVAGPGAVELDIFGTTDATDIASKLSSLVVAAAASEVRDGLWCKSSVASVAAVRLEDDRHVVVHAYRPDVTSDFIDGVVTVFNNDHDNTSKLGEGKEKEYVEDYMGRPFAINGVKGRYVRFYSKGNTSNEMNHYTEVEVYGKP